MRSSVSEWSQRSQQQEEAKRCFSQSVGASKDQRTLLKGRNKKHGPDLLIVRSLEEVSFGPGHASEGTLIQVGSPVGIFLSCL